MGIVMREIGQRPSWGRKAAHHAHDGLVLDCRNNYRVLFASPASGTSLPLPVSLLPGPTH